MVLLSPNLVPIPGKFPHRLECTNYIKYIDVYFGNIFNILLICFSYQVDTHVHASSCMNQKHLLRFMKKKIRSCPDDVVINSKNTKLTLSQVRITWTCNVIRR